MSYSLPWECLCLTGFLSCIRWSYISTVLQSKIRQITVTWPHLFLDISKQQKDVWNCANQAAFASIKIIINTWEYPSALRSKGYYWETSACSVYWSDQRASTRTNLYFANHWLKPLIQEFKKSRLLKKKKKERRKLQVEKSGESSDSGFSCV